MKTKLILAAAMLALTVPAKAQVVLDLSLITCSQFAGLPEADKLLISSWMGGYYSATKNLTTIDSRYVKRNHEVIGKYCAEHKSDKLLDVVMKEAH
ncbi:HdeA/HdeB family chaperone [Rhodoblastus sp.]|jgi:acid stress chaperone HdeB|uniref:HdeA/HdeB family chaperone n=1 Tax=Rhodoblastus sp. TaxID=1962975 RepID=UPI0025EC999B|nr:HdeA/HdeB family chaperone [Rhodoblastus sp.]